MANWLGAEGDEMRIAFTRAFGSRWREFGNPATQIFGYSDGKNGVQWQVGYDITNEERWAGINLEGMQYDDWPVARLIERELREPSILQVVRSSERVNEVELLWRRDYWQISARPDIAQRNIPPTPIVLGALTPEAWRSALSEARDCLDRRRKYHARATQVVTLPSGEQVEGEVSPHLAFRSIRYSELSWETFLQSARTELESLHRWTVRRAAQTISF
jgi:hypothetical protein